MRTDPRNTISPYKALVLSVFALFIGGAQCAGPTEALDPDKFISSSDSTDLLFRKAIPIEVEKAASEALSHFPELQNTYIIFSYDEKFHNSFMQAQPKVTSFFKHRKNRVYKIIMTRHLAISDTMIAVEDVPHKVLVGWIGHELGHIMDYADRSTLNMVWFGLRYVASDQYKSKAEREADLYAIRHGLAENIIATKNYILSNTALPESYINKIERLYLSPESVLEIVEELEEEREDDDDEAQAGNDVIEPYPFRKS